ncbi:MAG: universal stress protein [Verrucomicrobia bacterium]|nr:universal stress protein [Verrucomicrobiota bacterium]
MNPKPEPRGPPPEAAFTPGRIRTILAPVDFSPPSLAALRCAAAFAGHFGAQLVLLHVLEPVTMPDMEYLPMAMRPDRLVERAARKLRVLAKPQGGQPSRVGQTLVRIGKPFREITGAARELGADLIIIATHGHTGLERVLLGSTAERVVRFAPCPVLTLREPE